MEVKTGRLKASAPLAAIEKSNPPSNAASLKSTVFTGPSCQILSPTSMQEPNAFTTGSIWVMHTPVSQPLPLRVNQALGLGALYTLVVLSYGTIADVTKRSQFETLAMFQLKPERQMFAMAKKQT